MGSTQVRNALYKLEATDKTHVVVYKLDAGFALLETYHINIHPTFIICSCFAGAKDCRHQKMFLLWQEKNLWGKGWLYNYDRGLWVAPTPVEET